MTVAQHLGHFAGVCRQPAGGADKEAAARFLAIGKAGSG